MNLDNFPNLSKGQIIYVFPFNGKKVKGEFAGIACGNLLLKNCSVKNKNSIRHKVTRIALCFVRCTKSLNIYIKTNFLYAFKETMFIL